jgi:HK97 gp10 family phage protein
MNLTSFAKWQPRGDGGRFLAAKIDSAVAAGVQDWAQRVFDTSQELVPVDTGELKASGHMEVAQVGKQVFASISYDAEHSVYVEFGTGQRGAASAGAGPGPYSPKWPGMPAQPYLRPAFDAHREEATGVVAETVAVAIK